MPLVVGKTYTRLEVQRLAGIPNPASGGKWATGYVEHDGAFYVFSNVGMAGRTGHNYANRWDGDILKWEAKGPSRQTQPAMRRMLAPGAACHIFTPERVNKNETDVAHKF